MDFLNRIFRGDKVVWIVFLLLLLVSVVEVFSAASMLTYGKNNYLWAIRGHSVNLLCSSKDRNRDLVKRANRNNYELMPLRSEC